MSSETRKHAIAIIGTIVITLLTNSTVVLESPDPWKGIWHRISVDNIVTQQVVTTYDFYTTNYAPLLVLTNFVTGPNIRTNYETKPSCLLQTCRAYSQRTYNTR